MNSASHGPEKITITYPVSNIWPQHFAELDVEKITVQFGDDRECRLSDLLEWVKNKMVEESTTYEKITSD